MPGDPERTTDSGTHLAPLTRGSMGRRVAWGAADQALYGLTNIALSVMVAVSVDRRAFGAFSAVLIVYTISIGTVQGLVSEVFTVTHGTGPDDRSSHDLGAATGCALVLGVAVAAVALAVSAIGSGPLVATLPAFAVVVPAMYLQDTWRFALFSLGRPRSAFLNDFTWAVVQVVALGAARASGHSTVSAFVLAWGAGSLAGAALGIHQTKTWPRPLRAWAWLRQHGSLGGRFAGEFLTLFGAAQLVLAVLAATGGLAELARLRAGQVLFSPLQGLLNAVRLAVTSLAVQVWTRTPQRLGRFVVALAGALCLAALASGAGAVAVPDRWGRRILGDSWEGVAPVLAPLAVLNVALAVSLGALTALRALQASRESFRVRAVLAATMVVTGSAGAITGGAVGAAWGLAAASLAGLILMAVVTRWTLADRLRALDAPSGLEGGR